MAGHRVVGGWLVEKDNAGEEEVVGRGGGRDMAVVNKVIKMKDMQKRRPFGADTYYVR